MTTPTIDPVTPDPSPEAAPAGDTPSPERDRSGLTYEALSVLALVIAFVSMVVAVFAVGLAVRAIDEHRAIPAGGGGGGATAVGLAEFTISPNPVSVPEGATLAVTNEGTTAHDLAVEGEDLTTAALDAGDSEDLDLAPLAPGTYVVFCSIPGHRDSGMEGELTVG